MIASIVKSASERAKAALAKSYGRGGPSNPYEMYKPSVLPPLLDKGNVESEFVPDDFLRSPEEQAEIEKDMLELLDVRHEAAVRAQKQHHASWFTSWSFARGAEENAQWQIWNTTLNNYQTLRGDVIGDDDGAHKRLYRTFDKIGPNLLKLHAKALSAETTANVGPKTGRVKDKAAARQARGVIHHLDAKWDAEAIRSECIEWATQVNAPARYVYWDPTAMAEIPIFDAQGEIIDVLDLPRGEICEKVLSPFAWMGDPRATKFENGAYCFIDEIESLAYVQATFPKGYEVKPDSTSYADSGVQGRMASMTGDYDRQTQRAKDSCRVITMYEKKTALFPKGRFAVKSGNTLLAYQEYWPGGLDGTEFPVEPIYYKRSAGSMYGRSAVIDVVDAQISFNYMMNRVLEHAAEATYALMVPEGSEPDIDLMRSNSFKTLYTYKDDGTGRTINWMETPGLPAEFGVVLDLVTSFIQDNFGIHEVSNGQTPAGVTAASALKLLRDSDETQNAVFIKSLARAEVKLARLKCKMASKMYIEPRLIQYQDSVSSDPDAARSTAMTFKEMSDGRYDIYAASASANDPIFRAETVKDIMKAGGFAPEVLPVTKIFLDVLGIESSDKVNDDIEACIEEYQKNQPNPAQIEQMKQQQAMQAQEMQLTFQAKIEQMKMQVKSEGDQRAATMKMQIDGQVAAQKLAQEREIEQLKIESATAIEQMRQQFAAVDAEREATYKERLARLEASLEIAVEAAKRSLPPTIAPISVTADPTGVVAIEKLAGVEGKIPPAPKPASSGAKPA